MTAPEAVVIGVGDLGPWAGAAAVVWAVQTLGHLARSVAVAAAELGAIRRGLGLPGPEDVDQPPALPFTLTITRPT